MNVCLHDLLKHNALISFETSASPKSFSFQVLGNNVRQINTGLVVEQEFSYGETNEIAVYFSINRQLDGELSFRMILGITF